MHKAFIAEPPHSAAGVRFLITWVREALSMRALWKLRRDGGFGFPSEKIKDCFLKPRRWTCWFCLCCLSHVTLWRLSLNVLSLFDPSVFAKRSGVAYAMPYLIRLLITLYKLVCSLLFYCCCAFQLRITIHISIICFSFKPWIDVSKTGGKNNAYPRCNSASCRGRITTSGVYYFSNNSTAAVNYSLLNAGSSK